MLPTVYIKNYDSKMNIMIKTIENIDDILLIIDDKTSKTCQQLQKAREVLCCEIEQDFANIEQKDGVKSIRNLGTKDTIKYYGNGLIESATTQIAVHPFPYEFESNMTSNIEPSYHNIFRNELLWSGHTPLLPKTVSWLLHDYLLSKVNKPISHRKINLYDFITKFENFFKKYDKAFVCSDKQLAYSVMRKELKNTNILCQQYNKMAKYVLSGHFAEQTGSSVLYQQIKNSYYADSADTGVTKLQYYYNRRESTNTLSEHACIRNLLPYLEEKDAQIILKIYQQTFHDIRKTSLQNNDKNESSTAIAKNAERLSQNAAYDYYKDKYKTCETDIYDKLYDQLGFMSLYFTYDEANATDGHTNVTDCGIVETQGCNTFLRADGMHATILNIQINDYTIDKIKEAHNRLMFHCHYMLANAKEIYRLLYTIPNKDLHDFMIQKTILKENYCPEKINIVKKETTVS